MTRTPAAQDPPQRGRGAAAARTRVRVLEAATRVLADVGPDAASVQRITAEAGVSQGVVGWQFGSKSTLLIEVVDAAFQKVAEALSGAMAEDTEAPFVALAEAFEPLLGTPSGRVLVTSLAHVIPDEEALRTTYSAGLETLVAVAARAVRSVDPDLTEARRRQRAVAFVSVLLGYATQRVLDPDLDPAMLRTAGAAFDLGVAP